MSYKNGAVQAGEWRGGEFLQINFPLATEAAHKAADVAKASNQVAEDTLVNLLGRKSERKTDELAEIIEKMNF